MNIFLYFIVSYKILPNKEEWPVVTFVWSFFALYLYVHNAISDAHIIYMSITNKEEFLSWWHTAKVPQQPLAQRDLETSPKTRGAADRVSPWTYGPLIKLSSNTSPEHPTTYFFSKRGSERSQAFLPLLSGDIKTNHNKRGRGGSIQCSVGILL